MSKSSVEEIRKQIDSMDNKIHDLLMKRAELVLKIGDFKRMNNIQVVQPDREMRMVRRLLGRHGGPLPKEAVVRIWRELVGAVSLLQTGLKVAVTAADDASGILYWDMAKDYFSSVLPMQKVSNALGTLGLVREGDVTFGVVPWPDAMKEGTQPWWPYLMAEQGEKPMRIVGRLPLGNRSSQSGMNEGKALVIARLSFDPSDDDRSFILFDLQNDISRARIVDKIESRGLKALSLFSHRTADGQRAFHLLEVDDYLAVDDERLEGIVELFGDADARHLVVGGYPVPPVYDDSVGKAAESSILLAKADETKTDGAQTGRERT